MKISENIYIGNTGKNLKYLSSLQLARFSGDLNDVKYPCFCGVENTSKNWIGGYGYLICIPLSLSNTNKYAMQLAFNEQGKIKKRLCTDGTNWEPWKFLNQNDSIINTANIEFKGTTANESGYKESTITIPANSRIYLLGTRTSQINASRGLQLTVMEPIAYDNETNNEVTKTVYINYYSSKALTGSVPIRVFYKVEPM